MGGRWEGREGLKQWIPLCDWCDEDFKSTSAYQDHCCPQMQAWFNNKRTENSVGMKEPLQIIVDLIIREVAEMFCMPGEYLGNGADAKKRRLPSVVAGRYLCMFALQRITGCRRSRIAELLKFDPSTVYAVFDKHKDNQSMRHQTNIIVDKISVRLASLL